MDTLPPLSKDDLARLKFYVPTERSDTGDAIASLIVRAPDYRNKFFPKYNIDVGYSQALWGIDAVERRVKRPEQVQILSDCRKCLWDAYAAFKHGEEDLGYKLVQRADLLFRSSGRRSKPLTAGT